MIWYFAYGSNLCIDQMKARIGPSLHLTITPRIVRLPACRLAFNMRGQDGQFYANLHSPGEHVLGVLYACADDVFQKLAPFEEGYHCERLTVIDGDGSAVEVFAYVSDPENVVAGGAPSAEYMQRILRGGRHHGLPESYLRDIAEMQSPSPSGEG